MQQNQHAIKQHDDDMELQILRFMEISQCQDYQESKEYLMRHNFVLKNALQQYVAKKKSFSQSATSMPVGLGQNHSPLKLTQQRNFQQITLTSQQVKMFQKRLKTPSKYLSPQETYQSHLRQSTQNKGGFFANLCNSCKNSFNCFKKLKKSFRKKLNSMKNNNQKIFYFHELYEQELKEANLSIQQDLIESYELQNIQQNHKIKTLKNETVKPIFALIVPNRKNSLIGNILKKKQLINFLRQNFEIIFLTLSQLKEIPIDRKHILRNISKCPTALAYIKNFYNLQDQLLRYQGENVKNINAQALQNSLKELPNLLKKWNYLLNLQKHLKQNAITSFNQVSDYADDYYDEPQFQQNSSQRQRINSHNFTNVQDGNHKKSLIHEQTQIYKQMEAEQNKRKKSLELEKQKLQEMKQLREIRKISLPQEPSLQQLLLNKCIQFKFRCPVNGQFISRRFLKDEKVDILYQYIDTNQEIQFQTDPQRSFDLFTSFPPTSLSDKRQQLLKDIFDQQKQNILIRQI